MDYLHLKKTLIAIFDHFLSCHDRNDLEEMMQAFEVGKSLVIKFPEPIHREDYQDDVTQMMEAAIPKKTISRIRRKKPQSKPISQENQIKICEIPVIMDLSALPKTKQDTLRDTIKGDHHIRFKEIMVQGNQAFAVAEINKIIAAPIQNMIKRHDIMQQVKANILSQKNNHHNENDEELRQSLIKKIKQALGHQKKAKPP